MKRFLIYGLLGPALGCVTAFGVMLPLLGLFLSDPAPKVSSTLILIVLMLPFAYLHGIVPAMLSAAVDGLLESRRMALAWRVPAMALCGFAFAFIPLLSSIAEGQLPGQGRLIFGFVGAVPAAICCFLSRNATKPA